jgi:hypothetical protein
MEVCLIYDAACITVSEILDLHSLDFLRDGHGARIDPCTHDEEIGCVDKIQYTEVERPPATSAAQVVNRMTFFPFL